MGPASVSDTRLPDARIRALPCEHPTGKAPRAILRRRKRCKRDTRVNAPLVLRVFFFRVCVLCYGVFTRATATGVRESLGNRCLLFSMWPFTRRTYRRATVATLSRSRCVDRFMATEMSDSRQRRCRVCRIGRCHCIDAQSRGVYTNIFERVRLASASMLTCVTFDSDGAFSRATATSV